MGSVAARWMTSCLLIAMAAVAMPTGQAANTVECWESETTYLTKPVVVHHSYGCRNGDTGIGVGCGVPRDPSWSGAGCGVYGVDCTQAYWGIHTNDLVVGGHNGCTAGVLVRAGSIVIGP
ncbi:MAG: hypothetical protein ACPGQL_03570 [Thermoplasmatota archaeon]